MVARGCGPARIRSTSGLSASARKIAAQSQRIVVLTSTITWLSSTATPIATMTIAMTLITARASMRDATIGVGFAASVRYPAFSGAMTPPARQPRAFSFSSPSGGNIAGRRDSREHSKSHSRYVEGEGRWAPRTQFRPRQVHIFDTTLRDGEQSPGISLNTQEKVEIAQQLARLGVDVIEAGFPITSPGDFEAVEAIARERRGPGDLRPRPHPQGRHRRRLERDQGLRAAADPHLHLDLRHPHRPTSCRPTREDVKGQAKAAVALAKSYCEDVEFSPMDATRADVEFTAEVCAIAVAEGATVINIPDTVGYTTPEEYARYFARLYELVPRAARGRALGPLPRRPRARRRQLLRRAAGRRAPGRVRDQRDRRAGRQLLAGGDRDAAADPQRRARARHRRRHPRDRAHLADGLAVHRLRGAAEQGDRRAQRVRPRVRDPPGRRAEGAHHLRDHGRARRRAGVELDRARQALRPPRAARRARAARLPGRGQRAEPGVQAVQGDRGQEEAGDRARPRGDRLRPGPRGLGRATSSPGSTSRRRPGASRSPRSR